MKSNKENKFWTDRHKRRIQRLRNTTYKKPPWEQFPDYEPGDIAWRMGEGEQFIWDWQDWFRGLSLQRKEKYKLKHPEPKKWKKDYHDFNGFYAFICDHNKRLQTKNGKIYWDELLKQYLKPFKST